MPWKFLYVLLELPEDQLEELSISTLEEEALPNSTVSAFFFFFFFLVSAFYSSDTKVLLNDYIY